MQTGWGSIANKIKILNTQQYIALKKEAYENNNNQQIPAEAIDINGVWDPNRNVNWQDELMGETAQFQNLQASISGGSNQTQFLAGAGYIRETPVFKGDFSNVKSSVNFNINHASTDNRFKFYLSGSYLQGNNQLPLDDITSAVVNLAPNFPSLYNSDGTVNWSPVPGLYPLQATGTQPAANLLTRYTSRTSNLVANSTLSYEILPGLIIKSTLGYNSLESEDNGIYPSTYLSPELKSFNLKPFSTFSNKSTKSWIIEPQATYSKTLSFGSIDALVGTTFQNTDNYALSLRGSDYNNDLQLTDYNSAGTKSSTGSLQATYRYSAVFGRLNYRAKDRYIVNLAARQDGSSRFGSGNLFHNFYSVGAAWLFSEEQIFKKALPFINYGKFRISYGTTGNDQIPDYLFYSLYNTSSVAVPYLGVTALNPRGLSNPYLQWEETHKWNYGIDLGFFENKISLTANYFRNRSSNQLLSQNLSIVTGFGNIQRNLPALVQNTGWEFSLQYNPIKGKNFSWEGSVNLTLPKNKLLRYEGLDRSTDRFRFAIGESITLIKGYSFQGVNPETGIYQFQNSKGELTSSPIDPDDRIVFITTDPKWYGGLSNAFTYKQLSLNLFFNFVSQMGSNLNFQNIPDNLFNFNYLTNVLDHWRQKGDKTALQRISSNSSQLSGPFYAARESDGAYKKITYARLNNATLAYSFKNELLRDIHISNARLFIQGQNLFTISNYNNGDPEIQGTMNVGLLRRYTIGAQLVF